MGDHKALNGGHLGSANGFPGKVFKPEASVSRVPKFILRIPIRIPHSGSKAPNGAIPETVWLVVSLLLYTTRHTLGVIYTTPCPTYSMLYTIYPMRILMVLCGLLKFQNGLGPPVAVLEAP